MASYKKWRVIVNNFPADRKTAPCRVSIPFAPGQCRHLNFSVERPDGSKVPAQSRILVKYPDGSPRWIQLDFTGCGNGIYTIKNAPCAKIPGPTLVINETGYGYVVKTGSLSVTLSKQNDFPIQSIFLHQNQIVTTQNKWSIVAIKDREQYNFQSANNCFLVENCGENRFQASWKGFLVNEKTHERLLDVKMRVEFLAGVQGFSFSIHFFHCLENHPFINIERLFCQFSFPELRRLLLLQEMYSNFAVKRIVETNDSAEIFVDRTHFRPYVKDVSILDDDFEYPLFLRDLNKTVGDAVCLRNNAAAVVCCMRDFVHHRPKRVFGGHSVITYDIWPEFAGILNLQQGMSYRVVFDFNFSESPTVIENFLKNPQSIYVEPVYCWLEQCDSKFAGLTWHQQYLFSDNHPGAGIFSCLLSDATRRFHTISEMFHYGDTPDEGYTQYYFSHARYPKNKKKTDILFNTGGGVYEMQLSLEPVWSNNEYDAIYCLALEAMRTKSFPVLKRLIAAARHQIEIDFVHYSDHWQQHRSTPQHSYWHTAMMSSLPSHQWTQGLYHYYVLTGDDDAPDVIKGICDFNMGYFDKTNVRFDNFFNREFGWAILALVYGYEATGNISYIEKAEQMIKQMKNNTTPLQAKEAFGKGFYANTVLVGLMAYHQATKQLWAKNLFLKWVDYGMKNFAACQYGVRVTELFVEPAVYAYYLTGNKKYLKECFWHFGLFFKSWNDLGWLSGMGAITTKKYARVYRALVHFVSGCADAGLLEKFEKTLYLQ